MKVSHLIFPIMFFASLLFATMSCNDEETDPLQMRNDQLQGEWLATSVVIDGEEELGNDVSSLRMTYEETSRTQGSTVWTVIDAYGDVEDNASTYILSNDGKTITIENVPFSLDIDGDNLDLFSDVAGEFFAIEAVRN